MDAVTIMQPLSEGVVLMGGFLGGLFGGIASGLIGALFGRKPKPPPPPPTPPAPPPLDRSGEREERLVEQRDQQAAAHRSRLRRRGRSGMGQSPFSGLGGGGESRLG